MYRTITLASCLFLALCQSAPADGLYVAPNGNDAWSGARPVPNAERSDGPLATLQAARDAVRSRRDAGTHRIVVRGGEYFLAAPLVLEARDSGLTIEAAAGEKPVLCGGRKIVGWRQDGDRFWTADLPALNGKPWDFRLLIVDGRFCARARLPKTGTFTHLTDFKVPWMSTTGGGWKRKPTPDELTTMTYRAGDLGPWLDVRNAELTVYHMWDESMVGVASADHQAHTLRFSTPAGHPPGAFGVKKYVVWNVREGMTDPGQWYLDRSAGRVVYWPLPGEDMSRSVVIAPTMQSVVRLVGSQKQPVKAVTLKGLTLSVTNTPLIAGGFGAGKFDGAVEVSHGEGCRLIGLTVLNTLGQGIKAGACKDLCVEGCLVYQTGACGIKSHGSGARITNNHVHHVGLSYPSAIAVWGGGSGSRISYNEIHDTPYTAIACGGDGHCIGSNLIYRAMQVLHDGAGIYITFCKKVTLRGNLIRDIAETGGYGSSAYYLDEQAEGCIVEDNVSVRVPRPTHNHMAKGNTIRNNIFICDGDAALTFPKCSDFRFDRNVIRAKGAIKLSNPKAITQASGNVFYSGTGKIDGAPPDTIVADPGVVESPAGRFGFAPESPATRAGVEPVDVTAAGRRSTP